MRWGHHTRLLAAALVAALALAGAGATAAGAADLSIAKTDGPDPVSVGAALTYTIRVQNLGPEPATGVTVTDRLPKGVDFVSVTGGQCARKGRKVTCDLGTLGPPGIDYSGPPTLTLVVVPRTVGTISNTASVKGKGDRKDPVAANDRATATTTVVRAATCRGVPVTIAATAADDFVFGTSGRDVIAAFGGDDTIVSLAGRDLVCAGAGTDFVGAGSAADRVFGGAGRDRIVGRGGPDVLRGGAGGDAIAGSRGADRLRGGSGFDRCRGGPGLDSSRGCER